MTSNADTVDRIAEIRRELGEDLLILAHHYQSDNVTRHADQLGDSLELARRVADSSARHIVFCGVYFMAESAAVLAREGQTAYIPDRNADCSMSEMAPAPLVESVVARLRDAGIQALPLAYVNSQAAVKAVCGRNGGAICTSANAPTMLRWAMDSGRPVLFLPDQHLAWNTANALGLPVAERTTLDVRAGGERLDMEAASKARLLIWPGCCSVHVKNRVEQIASIRNKTPQALVVVHPESPAEVVDAADSAGSTSHIIRYCEAAPEGSHIYVGTEINLVRRLAAQHAPGKTILPLYCSACANMRKITEEKLLANLEAIADGNAAAYMVKTAGDVAEPSRLALTRMLDACA